MAGKIVSPELVPVRTLSDAAASIARLATGGLDDTEVGNVRIIGVQRGSAKYACLMESDVEMPASPALGGNGHHPSDPVLIHNLQTAGQVLADPESDRLTHQMLSPTSRLSKIASKLDGQIRIEIPGQDEPLASVQAESYERIRGVALMHDEATVHGYLVRVGGATAQKCAMRVYGRDRLLIGHVASKELSRQLGKHLYEPTTVYGRGLFFSRTWDLLGIRIDRATFGSEGDFGSAIDRLRDVGGDAWDDVSDVDGDLRMLR